MALMLVIVSDHTAKPIQDLMMMKIRTFPMIQITKKCPITSPNQHMNITMMLIIVSDHISKPYNALSGSRGLSYNHITNIINDSNKKKCQITSPSLTMHCEVPKGCEAPFNTSGLRLNMIYTNQNMMGTKKNICRFSCLVFLTWQIICFPLSSGLTRTFKVMLIII